MSNYEIYDKFEKIKEMDINDSLLQLQKNSLKLILASNLFNKNKTNEKNKYYRFGLSEFGNQG